MDYFVYQVSLNSNFSFVSYFLLWWGYCWQMHATYWLVSCSSLAFLSFLFPRLRIFLLNNFVFLKKLSIWTQHPKMKSPQFSSSALFLISSRSFLIPQLPFLSLLSAPFCLLCLSQAPSSSSAMNAIWESVPVASFRYSWAVVLPGKVPSPIWISVCTQVWNWKGQCQMCTLNNLKSDDGSVCYGVSMSYDELTDGILGNQAPTRNQLNGNNGGSGGDDFGS